MSTQSLAVVAPQTALARPALSFSPEQRKMIRDSFTNGASDSEFAVLMAVAEARGLNPLLKQIHFVKRWDSKKRAEVWSYQTSIDGLRAIAERTGKYDGQDDAVFEYEADGRTLKLAKVNVYKKGISRPFSGTARFKEYAATTKEGALTSFWAGKPHIMLAKCAEALAIRKAFPEDTGGLHIPEEVSTAKRAAPVIEGEVVSSERSPAIAGQLIARIEQGFESREEKMAWATNNRAAKDACSAEDQARITEAFKKAPIVQTMPTEPARKEEPEPPESDPNEPPLFADDEPGEQRT